MDTTSSAIESIGMLCIVSIHDSSLISISLLKAHAPTVQWKRIVQSARRYLTSHVISLSGRETQKKNQIANLNTGLLCCNVFSSSRNTGQPFAEPFSIDI